MKQEFIGNTTINENEENYKLLMILTKILLYFANKIQFGYEAFYSFITLRYLPSKTHREKPKIFGVVVRQTMFYEKPMFRMMLYLQEYLKLFSTMKGERFK